jgi:5-methylcytosine-specific restriction endonuclease McrA
MTGIPHCCDYCGNEYLARLDSPARFCSRQCSGKASNPPKTLTDREGYLRCVKCLEIKPEDAFSRSARSPTGRKPTCRDCVAAAWRANRTPEQLERLRANGKRYYAENVEKVAAYQRAYREAYPEKAAERNRRWAQANPHRRSKAEQRRRALRIAATIVEPTAAALKAKWDYWGRCWICGGPPDTWDHVKPLAKGGSHCLANLRPACRSCNASKSSKWPWPYHRAFPKGRST